MHVNDPRRYASHGRPLLFGSDGQPSGPIPTLGVTFHNGLLIVTVHLLTAQNESTTKTCQFPNAEALTEWVKEFQNDPERTLREAWGYTGVEQRARASPRLAAVPTGRLERRVITLDDLDNLF